MRYCGMYKGISTPCRQRKHGESKKIDQKIRVPDAPVPHPVGMELPLTLHRTAGRLYSK